MEYLDGPEVAGDILDRDSVQGGTHPRWNNQKAWVYFNALIPYPFQETDTKRGGLGLIGWPIAPGQIKNVSVMLPEDYPYRMINTKFTCYELYGDIIDHPLTGTITTVAGSLTLAGAGTLFGTEIVIGQTFAYLVAGVEHFATIASIESATSATLDNAPSNSVAGSLYSLAYKRWFSPKLPQIKSDLVSLTNVNMNQVTAPGTITIPTTSVAVTGVSTLFNSGANDLTAGDIIEYPLNGETVNNVITEGVSVLNRVATVVDDTNITTTIATVGTQAVTAKPYKRVGTVQTGTIAVTAGTGAVVGVLTTFLSDFIVGDVIFYYNGTSISAGTISAIASDLLMTLVVSGTLVTVGAGTVYAKQISKPMVNIKRPGTITVTKATGAVVGVGTKFLSNFGIGDRLYYTVAGELVIASVATITSDLLMTLTVTTDLINAAAVTYFSLPSAPAALPLTTFENRFTPLTNFVKVSLNMPSLRSRFLYGGPEIVEAGFVQQFLTLQAFQTSLDGAGMVRTESLLPLNAIVSFQIQNTYDKTLYVNGNILGYKVAIEEN